MATPSPAPDVPGICRRRAKDRALVCDTAKLLNESIAKASRWSSKCSGQHVGHRPWTILCHVVQRDLRRGYDRTGVPPTSIDTVIASPRPIALASVAARSRPKTTGRWVTCCASAATNSVRDRPSALRWVDIPLLRDSQMINGVSWLVVTKLDVLDNSTNSRLYRQVDGKPKKKQKNKKKKHVKKRKKKTKTKKKKKKQKQKDTKRTCDAPRSPADMTAGMHLHKMPG